MSALSPIPRLWKARQLISILFLLLATLAQDGLGSQRCDGFAEGREVSARRGVRLLVLAHGSDWNKTGQRFLREVFQPAEGALPFTEEDIVLVTVDHLQAPSNEEREAFKTLHGKWKRKNVKTFPSVLAFAPDGTKLGTREGRTLPAESEAGRQAMLELAEAARRAIQLRRTIAAAVEDESIVEEVDAIHATLALPLDVQQAHVDRLEVIDPQDESGVRRRLRFPNWNTLISQATKESKAGELDAVVVRLTTMLDQGIYTDPQQAWIHVALGAAHRVGSAETAHDDSDAAFRIAWQLDPDGMAGNAGKRLALRLADEPSLLFGWQTAHCALEERVWKIQDLPETLAPGLWTITFVRTRGRNSLGVTSVALVEIATGEVISSDIHDALISNVSSGEVFRVAFEKPVSGARLEVTCAAVKGTNCSGSISLQPE